MYKIIYTQKARQDLKSLDNQIHQRIIGKIYEYSLANNPLFFAKKLHSSPLGNYRFRIGDYRAIFDIDENKNIKILLILTVAHRKDIYEN